MEDLKVNVKVEKIETTIMENNVESVIKRT
jgi:hypothetical protein